MLVGALVPIVSRHLALQISATDYRQCPLPSDCLGPETVPGQCRCCQNQSSIYEKMRSQLVTVNQAMGKAGERHSRQSAQEGDSSYDNSPMAIWARGKTTRIRQRKAHEDKGERWESDSEADGVNAYASRHSAIHNSHHHVQSHLQTFSEQVSYGRQNQQCGQLPEWKAWQAL
jgi:hypothetical protein